MSAETVALVLGPSGAGKTCIVRRLLKGDDCAAETVAAILDTAPTVGVEYDVCALSKSKSLALREVGSAMRAMWHSYFEAAAGMMYVADASASWKDAEALVDMLELRGNAFTSTKPMLIVFNKWDDVPASDREGRKEEIMELYEIIRISAASAPTQVVLCSTKDAENTREIRAWLSKL